MRVFTIVSRKGENWYLAKKIRDEGNRTVVFISEPTYRHLGNGVVDKQEPECIDDLLYPTPDCVIMDGIGMAKTAEDIEKKNITTIGSSYFGDQVTQDKAFALRTIKVLELANPVQGTIGIDVELWFNKMGVVLDLYRFSDTRFLERDRGPRCYMGAIIVCGNLKSKILTFLEPLIKQLVSLKYKGSITCSVMIGKDSITLNDINAYQKHTHLQELLVGKINDFLYALATGVPVSPKVKATTAMELVVGLLPFPLEYECELYKYVSLNIINDFNRNHVWLVDMVLEDVHKSGCTSGKLLYITSRGNDIREARRRAYRTATNICVPDIIYRADVGMSAYKKLEQLVEWKWL